MDVSPFVAVLLIGLLCLFFIFATRRPSPSRGHDRRLPPSPPGLPLLGHLPILGSLPHRKLRSLAEVHGPVMLLRLGRVPTVVASSAAAAQEAMKTRDLAFASRSPVRMAERLLYGRDMVFAPYGEYWRQARRVSVLHLLSQRRVQSFRRDREQEVAALLDRIRRPASSTGVVNLSDLLISYAYGVISRAAFGDGGGHEFDGDVGGGGKLRKVFADFEELLGAGTVGEFVPWLAWVDTLMGLDAEATRTFQALDGLLERVLADHRVRRRDGRRVGDGNDDDHRDFVDVLLDVNDAEEKTGGVVQFDTTAIKAIILDMFAAAIDTSFTTLEWAMAELINHPDEMRRLQAEIRAAVAAGDKSDQVTEDHLEKLPYLKCVVKETLRLHAPVPLLVPRETVEDTELLGYHVPARTRVVINAWAIGRDPAAWERAEEFVPERFASDPAEYVVLGQGFNFVPFGAGRRGCPGIGFALPSIELVLASQLFSPPFLLFSSSLSRTPSELDPRHRLELAQSAAGTPHTRVIVSLSITPPRVQFQYNFSYRGKERRGTKRGETDWIDLEFQGDPHRRFMGLLKLNLLNMEHRRLRHRLQSHHLRHRIQSHRRRRHRSQSHEGSIASRAKSGCSPCQQAETSLAGQMNGHPGPNLPEDIWCQIHSLLPMRDAARVACVSHAFEQSWRYHPHLVFNEETLGINVNTCRMDEKMRYFTSKVDCILKKHSGIGIRTLKLKAGGVRNAKVNSWLRSAVRPGIEELNLELSSSHGMCSFPYSLLSGGTRDSLRCLILASCHFHPTELVCLKSLTRLDLVRVYISEEELECLLSNSFSLEQLKLHSCNNIVCLKIPCLQKLSSLEVYVCSLLQVIESKAPNLSNFRLSNPDALSLRGTRPIKKLCINFKDAVFYARTELPSSMPSLETLSIISHAETIGTPMVNSKFLHLKFLGITFCGYGYDFLSLVSFFESSPSLETFYLNAIPACEKYVSIFQDPLNLRTVPEQVHEKLKRVEIINFFSAKSLIELTCHIVQSARSLERLTLDTTNSSIPWPRCSVNKSGKCLRMSEDLIEAHRAILAVQTYVKPNVPSTVELNVVEPCKRCHDDL